MGENSTDEMEQALRKASLEGDAKLAKIMLDNGANPNAANSMDEAPAYFSAKYGHLEVLRLLAGKADFKKDSFYGKTPLMAAAEVGNFSCVEFLLQFSDPAQVDRNGCSALVHAMSGTEPSHVACALILAPISDWSSKTLYGPKNAQTWAERLNLSEKPAANAALLWLYANRQKEELNSVVPSVPSVSTQAKFRI